MIMRLLICTQVIDKDDPYLGFFIGWVEALAVQIDSIDIIALKVGRYSLPPNVRVHSLGKENGRSPARYLIRFYRYAWRFRKEYDAVFVHMNEEYMLLGGVLWRLLRKPASMWRNHYAGSLKTCLAVWMSTKVFCTSQYSYTARFRKTKLMPLGIDTVLYHPMPEIERVSGSILFYARMSPSKRPEMLVGALARLKERGAVFTASFYGTALSRDAVYAARVQEEAVRRLGPLVSFYPGRPHVEGPAIFSAHELFVNLGESGMYDKMIFEAAACGCIVLAASKDYAKHVPAALRFESEEELAARLQALLSAPSRDKEALSHELRALARSNGLEHLAVRVVAELT
jgi:glycosyltransferase involved in cell wall biosynthesis